MPYTYTHVRTAFKGLAVSGYKPQNLDAFQLGASGPDPLFSYKSWSKAGGIYNLKQTANKMHNEKTGAFLMYIIENAKSETQKSYVLGFLSHYALDWLAHPYVAYLTAGENAVYSMPYAHNVYEAQLDSYLYKKDFEKRLIPIQAQVPRFIGCNLAEVCALIRDGVRQVYGEEIPFLALSETFHDNRFLLKFSQSRFGFKKLLAKFIDFAIIRKKNAVYCHMKPKRMKNDLPQSWQSPYNGEEYQGGIMNILNVAERTGGAYIKAATAYWQQLITKEQLMQIIQSKSYDTGLPV